MTVSHGVLLYADDSTLFARNPDPVTAMDIVNIVDDYSMDPGKPDSGNQSNNIDFKIINSRNSKLYKSLIQPNHQRYRTVIQHRFDPNSTVNDNDNTPVFLFKIPIFLHVQTTTKP